jgi:hypothetical protein
MHHHSIAGHNFQTKQQSTAKEATPIANLGPCNGAIELRILGLVLPVAACSFLSSPVIIVVIFDAVCFVN